MTSLRTNTEESKKRREEIGAFLKKRRNDLNLTQKYMGQQLALDYYTYISQMEAGKTRVPSEMIEGLAKVLKLDCSAFSKLLLAYYDPAFYKAIYREGIPKLVYEELVND